MNVTDYIRHLLTEYSGHSLQMSVDLYIALLPDAPDNVAALYDKSGEAPVNDLSGTSIQYSDVLILVRDLDYQQAFTRLQKLDEAVNLTRNQVYNQHTFILVHRISDVVFNYFDEKKRAVASATYRVYYTLN